MGTAKKIGQLPTDEYNRIMYYNGSADILPDTKEYLIAVGTAQFQKEFNLTIDGKCGPLTQDKIEEFLGQCPGASPDPDPTVVLPVGKGMFIRSLSHGGSPEDLVNLLQKGNYTWVCIELIRQYERQGAPKLLNLGDKYNDYWNALKLAGIDVWAWGWPVPGQTQEFIDRFLLAHAQHGISGVLVDAETEWKGESAAAEEFARATGEAFHAAGMSVGLSSYGAPWIHKTYPFAKFAEHYDFGNPQNYDLHNGLGAGYPTKSNIAWTNKGFKAIIPAGPGWNKTPEQLRVLFANTPMQDGAYICWDLVNLNNNADLAEEWEKLEV